MKAVLRVNPPPEVLSTLRTRFPQVEFAVCPDEASLGPQLPGADILIGGIGLTAGLLSAAPRLRWVQSLAMGMDRFFEPSAIERGIALTNGRGINAPSVADLTLAMMLAFARRLPELQRAQDRRHWVPNAEAPRPFELSDQALLLVGFGEIGRAITTRARAFGMQVSAVRRAAAAAGADEVRVGSLDALDAFLGAADHVVLALPLTAESRHIIDRRRLALLKPTAFLYNVGRGGLIDEAALAEALRAGRLAGAGLDVAEREPLPTESELWSLPNLMVTHHTGGLTDRFWPRATALLVDNLARFLDGRPLRNLVDPKAGY